MVKFKKSKKKFISTLVVLLSVVMISGSAYASGITESSNNQSRHNSSNVAPNLTISTTIPSNDINVADEFIFTKGEITIQGTSEPSSEWDFSKGSYSVNGSSNSDALFTNYYFKDVVGRTFNFTAGSSNRLKVDLVHKGWLVQSVVSTWTIDAGESKKVKIKKSDLDGKSTSGSYYFRFNSDPIGNSYSVSGTFK